MQYDRNNDFDLQVREMLKDAEEKVPSRVWSAVSDRIAKPAAGSSPVWWKWALGAGVAAFAALSAIFLVPDAGRGVEDVTKNATAEVITPQPPSTVTEEESPAEDIILSNYDSRKISRYIAQSKVDVSTVTEMSEAAVEMEMAEAAEAEETSGDVKAESADHTDSKALSRDTESRKNIGNTNIWGDPFAEPEVRKKTKRMSITVDGALLGNDSERAEMARPWMGGFGTNGLGMQELSTSTYGIPLSFGIGVRFSLNDKFSIGTGINYSLLSRKFDGSYQGRIGEVTHNLHYIGIPVNLYYNVLQSNSIKFYAFGGGEAEYGISNRYTLNNATYTDPVEGLQYSAAIGIGVEFKISNLIGIYIDPSARYYFNCRQPNSIRTVQPFMLNFEAGLRFSL